MFAKSLTPELTGAGGPVGPQGTDIGHQNREAMANVGVRVERFVRLGRVGRVWQVGSSCVKFEFLQKSGKRPLKINSVSFERGRLIVNVRDGGTNLAIYARHVHCRKNHSRVTL
jgi:hypothetical protein